MITTFYSECFSNLTKDHVYLKPISHGVRKISSEACSFNNYEIFITYFRRERPNQLTDIRKSKSKTHQQNNKIKVFYYHRLRSDLNNSQRFPLNEEVELINCSNSKKAMTKTNSKIVEENRKAYHNELESAMRIDPN